MGPNVKKMRIWAIRGGGGAREGDRENDEVSADAADTTTRTRRRNEALTTTKP